MKLIRRLSLALLNRSGIGLVLVLSLLLTHSIYSYSKQQKMTSIGRTTARDASVDGKRAINQLKQQGLYASIKDAIAGIKYEAKWQNSPKLAGVPPSHELRNAPTNLLAYVNGDGLQITSLDDAKTPWRLGLKLVGYGHSAAYSSLLPGDVTASSNRIAITHRSLSSKESNAPTEFFINSSSGIEHQIVISTSAGESTGRGLNVLFQVTGDLTAHASQSGNAAYFNRETDGLLIGYEKLLVVDANSHQLPAKMSVESGDLIIAIEDSLATYPITIDPLFVQQQKMIGSDTVDADLFGTSVAASGNTAVMSAPGADEGSNTDQGATFVFVQNGSTWAEQQKLTASDGGANDQFGNSVSISGDTIVVGAYLDDVGANADQGSAYVFVRSGTTWSQQAKLTASDGAAGDNFGKSVSVNGESIVVGANLDDVSGTDRGSAYVFVRSGTTWSQQTKLTAADGAAQDHFGCSVGIFGDSVVVGANTDDVLFNDQGSAYVFVRSGTTWSQQTKLGASDGALGDQFGTSVAIFGDTVVVGAPLDDGGATDQGSGYVFFRTGTTWAQQAKLAAPGGNASDQFGSSLAISSDTIVIGAFNAKVGVELHQGTAFVFVRSGTVWSELQQLSSSDGFGGDHFGTSVAISGNSIIAGADRSHVHFNFEGAAYAFVRASGSWVPQAFLTSTDGAEFDHFGFSVGISGDTAVIGAYLDDGVVNPDQGSAFVFVRAAGLWMHQATLTASDGAAKDNFGRAVCIAGNTIVIGAPSGAATMIPPGAAYVFVRNGSTWSEQQKLTASDGLSQDGFGKAVSIDGNTVIIGAPSDDVGGNLNQGSAYVFVRNGASWTQQAKLTGSSSQEGGGFGISVGISGDSVIVGAFMEDANGNEDSGCAYVFVRGGTTWLQQQRLIQPATSTSDRFGRTVCINGDVAAASPGTAFVIVYVRNGSHWTEIQRLTGEDGSVVNNFGDSLAMTSDMLVVGAPDNTSITHGAVYVYSNNGSEWSRQAILTSPNGTLGENFGVSVAVSGDTVIAGDDLEDVGGNNDQGSAYVFVRNWDSQGRLVAADGAAGDGFGSSIAVSGNTAVVGSHFDDVGANSNQGSAYVFTHIDGAWLQQQLLTASDGAASDAFGSSVSISGDTIVVGALSDDVGANSNQGSAYVFVRNGSNWTQQQKLTASDGAAGDNFGNSISLDGDSVVIGAFQDNTRQGSAYVFVRNGTTWTQQQKLIAADGAGSDLFGGSVGISGETVVVGASGDDVSFSNQGSAYVFTRNGATWSLQQKLLASDAAASDSFGSSVAVCADSLVVGADSDAIGANTGQGSAYVFTRTGVNWNEQQKLIAADGSSSDNFGGAVAISGNTIVVGALNDDLGFVNQGSAYVFAMTNGIWTERQQFSASDGLTSDTFGVAVAVCGNVIFIGADDADVGANTNQGAAYVFTMASNSSPIAVAGPNASRLRGSSPTTATIARVSDGQDESAFLSATASAPPGINVSGISNNNGVITASISSNCTAPLGNNFVQLTTQDLSGASSTVQFLVIVTANTPPVLGSYPATNVLAGTSTTVTPTAPPSDNGSIISLTASPNGFTGSLSVDATTGQVFITSTGGSGTFTVNVNAVDNCGSSALTTFQLNVTCPSITVSPASIPNATAGANYSQNFTQTGGVAPIVFNLTGALPTGMTFSGATLSGVPTQIGTFPITVIATDQFNCSASRGYTLIVNSAPLIWNGSLSSDWDNAANWTPNVVPAGFHDVTIPDSGVTNQPTIGNASASVNALTIQANRVLTINSSIQLSTAADVDSSGLITGAGKLSLAGAAFTQNGSISVASVEFGAGNHTLQGGGAFPSGIVTALGGANVFLSSTHSLNVLVINNGASFDCSNQQLILTGAGTPIFNSGFLNATGSTIVYQGLVPQSVTPNISYQNLTANNPAGLSLGGDTAVTGELKLLSDLSTGPFTLVIPAGGISSGVGDLIGNLKRTGLTNGVILSFGNPLNTIRFDSGAPPVDLTVNLKKSAPPGVSANTIPRTYTITANGGSGFSATLRLHYEDAELSGLDESSLELFRFNGSSWQSPAGQATRDTVANWVEEAGITAFSPWAIAAPSGPTAVELMSFSASSLATGTLIEWRTGMEVSNLGFNLYRDSSNSRELVNRGLIAGSALMTGLDTPMTAGRSYQWFDDSSAAAGSIYWLEDVDTFGRSTWHGPVASSPATGAVDRARLRQALALSNIGTGPIESTQVESTANVNVVKNADAQSSIASRAAVKLGIRREGWYRITKERLVAAGLDPTVDPRRLQLFVSGAEQPMIVNTKKEGGFDSIEFYGIGVDTPSTDTRLYWLSVGTEQGKRVGTFDARAKGEGATSFLSSVELKQRSIYFPSLLNGDQENWFGPVVTTQPISQTLTLHSLDTGTSEPAELEIALQGVTQLPGTLDHQIRVTLNGQLIGRILFDGQQHRIERFNVAASTLSDGAHVSLSAEGGPGDVSLVDYVRLSYRRRYVADDDHLQMTVPGGVQSQKIRGFSSQSLRVFDITDPGSIIELQGAVSSEGPSYAVTVSVRGSTERTLLATANEALLEPVSIVCNEPSTLRSPSNGADLIVITARSLMPSLEALKSLRLSQGVNVVLVDVEDVYDEFNFGEKSPQAVRDFLSYAKSNWKKKPKFVLLAGDASTDPRDYLRIGTTDIVPTRLVDTDYLETASDDWFCDFDNDGVADIAIGRLPVRTPDDCATIVRKVVRYDSALPNQEMLLIADANDGFDFEGASRNLLPLIPSNIRATQLNRGVLGTSTTRERLREGIERGQRYVNYAGHGSANVWRDQLLDTTSAEQLENASLPVFLMMTCLNGYFHDAVSDSLSESLLKAHKGGAIAVWASSGMTLADEQLLMNREFYRLVFSTPGLTIGEVTRRAKIQVQSADIRRTWLLLGDPSMRLH